MSNIYMGIDISTQSATVEVLDIGEKTRVLYEDSISYTEDARLKKYALDTEHKCIPNLQAGEFCQPPTMFLDALDIIFGTMKSAATYNMSDIQSISVSAQQHGHVYLSKKAVQSFESVRQGYSSKTLSETFSDAFSYPHAPIWMFSASQGAADEIREYIGNSVEMMKRSGSDSPARFTGAVIRYLARTYHKEFANTTRVHLLSSFVSGVLAGREDCPIDWGNGSGMSMMHYEKKQWDDPLCAAVLSNTQFATQSNAYLKSLLPRISPPTETVGNIAHYFVQKYGFNKTCAVAAGSGDNPQSKVCVQGDLLSLGTSFVIMADTRGKQHAPIKDANAMYDGLGNPFVFGCRTNGALVWDYTRAILDMDFKDAEEVLKNTKTGTKILLWQPFAESFPLSPQFEATKSISNAQDYVAVVESTLAILRYYSEGFMKCNTREALCVTGGPTSSHQILQRVANFWNRPVTKIGSAGAAYGAALSACSAHTSRAQRDAQGSPAATVYPVEKDVTIADTFTKSLIEKYRTVLASS